MKIPKVFFIVDDDIDDQEIFLEAVSEVDNSICCFCANNGEEALQLLKDHSPKPDLIFLDLNMPRINGRQCLIELKKSDELKHIPVIIYSTSSRNADIEETKNLGAAHFLTKPSNFSDLCDAIKNLLEKNWNKVPL